MSMSPIPWTLCTEIFPTHVRGLSNSLTTTSNFLFNYFVSAVFLTATSSEVGKVVSYLVLALFAVLAWIFVYTCVPETKGKSLQDCVDLFMT